MGILAAVPCAAAHALWGIRYPVERAALYMVPLVMLAIGLAAARSRVRWLRLSLWGLLLVMTGIGLQGVNWNHTLTWRRDANIPSVLLELQEIHQRTGERVVLAMSDDMKPTTWYYAEHLLGLRPNKSLNKDLPYKQTYEWFTVYEWNQVRLQLSFGADQPFIPGTTHVLLDRADAGLLAAHLARANTLLRLYPASDTTLYMVNVPEHQGVGTFSDGRRYAGEFKDGELDGRGTMSFPDGREYVGEFKGGLANGQGTLTRPGGQKYVGEFKHGEPDGQGTAVYPDGRKYFGGFRHSRPDGRGTLTFPGGQKYEGEFRNGKMDGAGKMTSPDGAVQAGLWRENQFVGPMP